MSAHVCVCVCVSQRTDWILLKRFMTLPRPRLLLLLLLAVLAVAAYLVAVAATNTGTCGAPLRAWLLVAAVIALPVVPLLCCYIFTENMGGVHSGLAPQRPRFFEACCATAPRTTATAAVLVFVMAWMVVGSVWTWGPDTQPCPGQLYNASYGLLVTLWVVYTPLVGIPCLFVLSTSAAFS